MSGSHQFTLADSRHIFDADLTSDGVWVAIIGQESADAAIFCDQEIRLPRKFRFPNVRVVDRQHFLVVESRVSSANDANAALVNLDAAWAPRYFPVGDGVQDVLITANFIVCTYFDEGIFGATPISHEGVAVFDKCGAFQFGYRTRLKGAAVDIADCYAACHIAGDSIAFSPYDKFPLVNWDLNTGAQSLWRLPGSLHGAQSLVEYRGGYFLHSPRKHPHAVFHWQDGKSKQVAMHAGRLKPLGGGRFLEISANEVSVVDLRTTL